MLFTMLFTVAASGLSGAAGWALGRRGLLDDLQVAREELGSLRAVRSELEQTLRDERAALERALHEVGEVRAEALRNATELAREYRDKLRKEIEAELARRIEQQLAQAKEQADRLLEDARKRALDRTNEAQKLTNEAQKLTQECNVREERLDKRETAVEKREELVGQRELELSKRDRSLADRERTVLGRETEAHKLVEERKKVLEDTVKKERETLEHVASLSAEDARKRLIDDLLEDAKASAAREAKQLEDLARDEAEKRAKRIVGIALQRYAGDYASERAVTTVHLPNDELKGRIIGREGRNIRAFQEVTGCDLVVDDTPETIVVSAFDPVKREVARLALEKLIADGRIHPTKIEECVLKAREEVDRAIKDAADQAVLELGLGRLHPDLLKLLGSLRYRYSYAQNVLRHSVEVGFIAGLMAGELGCNVKQARRAGFLHDLGKAVTHEVEGGHAVIGAQHARRCGEEDLVVNAIAAHHEDEPARSLLAHLVMSADAVSGARP